MSSAVPDIRFRPPEVATYSQLAEYYAGQPDTLWHALVPPALLHVRGQEGNRSALTKKNYLPLLRALFPAAPVRTYMQEWLCRPLQLEPGILAGGEGADTGPDTAQDSLDEGYIGYLRRAHHLTGLGENKEFSPQDDKTHLPLDARLCKQNVVDALALLARNPHALVTVAALQSFFISALGHAREEMDRAYRQQGKSMPPMAREAFRELYALIPYNRPLFAGTYTFTLVLLHRFAALRQARPPGALNEQDCMDFAAYAPRALFVGPRETCPFAGVNHAVMQEVTGQDAQGHPLFSVPGQQLWKLHGHVAEEAGWQQRWLQAELAQILRQSCVALGLTPGHIPALTLLGTRTGGKPHFRLRATPPQAAET